MLNVAERFACDHLELQTALEPPSVTRIMIVGTMIEWLKDWARSIKQDVHALYLASRDPRVPWYAKAMGLLVAGYALSPIDLIPDFIPVLGYLDDLILVPLGILLAIQLIPRNHGRTPPLGRSRTSETEVASCSGYNCRYLDCLGDDLRTACFLPFPVNKQLTNYPQAPHSQLPGQLTRSAQVRCAKANVGGS